MFNQSISLSERLRVLVQYSLPRHFLTKLVFKLARCRWKLLKNSLIRLFILWFKVDMRSALQPEPTRYENFNYFFTRQLKPEARPLQIDAKKILCPVDGSISQIGNIEYDTLLQAKGITYQLQQLLVREELATTFTNGNFATLYLSPRDYHRIHMPLNGTLQRMIYVPGRLFAVDRPTVRIVPSLFARNERVINIFRTDFGNIAIIMVGAMLVGSMETVWAGQITPAENRQLADIDYPLQNIQLQQGEEMGRFNMGSTVILLLEANKSCWLPDMKRSREIIMGETIATII